MTSLTDLITALTDAQIKTTALTILEELGFPVASWHKGAIYRTIVALFSKLVAPFTDLQVLLAKSGFLDWAEPPWLYLVAEQVYGLTIQQATFAVGNLTINNSEGGDFTFGPREFRCFNSITNKIFVNRLAFTVSPFETGVSISIEAEEIGSASNSEGGTIDGIETPGNGLSCTNPDAIIGLDIESPASIRIRCRAKPAAISPQGAAGAHDYIARSSDLNGGVAVTRTNPVPDSDIGEATLYIAGPSGAVEPSDVALVQDAIDRLSTPTGYDVTVLSATEIVVNVSAQVWYPSSLNMTPAEVAAVISASVTAWLSTRPVGGEFKSAAGGGKVWLPAIEGEIKRPIPQVITIGILVPAAHVNIAPSEVPVPGVINIVATQVDE